MRRHNLFTKEISDLETGDYVLTVNLECVGSEREILGQIREHLLTQVYTLMI